MPASKRARCRSTGAQAPGPPSLQGVSVAELGAARRRGADAQRPAIGSGAGRRDVEGRHHEPGGGLAPAITAPRTATTRPSSSTGTPCAFPNGDAWLVVTPDRQRPHLSPERVHDEHALQARGRRIQMASHAVPACLGSPVRREPCKHSDHESGWCLDGGAGPVCGAGLGSRWWCGAARHGGPVRILGDVQRGGTAHSRSTPGPSWATSRGSR